MHRLMFLIPGLLVYTSVIAAPTEQDFTSTFPDPNEGLAYLTSISGGLARPPEIIEGWDGNAGRITHDGAGGQNSSIAWDTTIEGGYTSLDVTFQIRGSGVGVGAEGFGFGLLNTAEFGERTSAGLSWQPDEPNLAGSIGIGFDLFNNANLDPKTVTNLDDSISLHYDRAIIEQISTDELFDVAGEPIPSNWLESNNPLQVAVNIQQVGEDANLAVTMVDLVTSQTVFVMEEVVLPGFSPYEARLAFGGRTIGVDTNTDVDNITYRRDGGELVTIDTFESYGVGDAIPPLPPSLAVPVGGTPFVLQRTEGEPGPTIFNQGEGAGTHPGHLQLTQEVPGTRNYIIFNKTSDDTSRIEATFDFRIKNVTNRSADGMAVVFADTAVYGDEGLLIAENIPPWFEAEEPNLENALGIGFDTFDNDEEGNPGLRANHVSIHWNDERVGDVISLDRNVLDLVGDEWHKANILVEQDAGGMVVNMSIVDGTDGSVHEIFSNFVIPEAAFQESARVAFGGRTGDLFDIHELDNVLVQFGPPQPLNDGDFNDDGAFDTQDIDALSTEVFLGTDNLAFDLTGDGTVDQQDLTQWLSDAASENGFNEPYLVGDANLDGTVDSLDLNSVGVNWQQDESRWSGGDFNGSGRVDSNDLNDVGVRWQQSISMANAVPEPGCSLWALLAISLWAGRSKRIGSRFLEVVSNDLRNV